MKVKNVTIRGVKFSETTEIEIVESLKNLNKTIEKNTKSMEENKKAIEFLFALRDRSLWEYVKDICKMRVW